jgi:hypothetical protein
VTHFHDRFAIPSSRYFRAPAVDASTESGRAEARQSPHLLAVVKENLDDESRNFLPTIAPVGTLLLQKDMSLWQMLRVKKMSFWDLMSWGMLKKHSADKKAHGGNMKGEGMGSIERCDRSV